MEIKEQPTAVWRTNMVVLEFSVAAEDLTNDSGHI